MTRLLTSLAAGFAVALGGLWLWTHRPDQGRVIVERHGLFGPTITTIGIGEVLDDVRPLNRLVVFRAYLTATTTTHEVGWITHTDQTMITPAYVNYYVDMAAITPRAIRVDGRTVTVALPPIMIERPNIDMANVQLYNSGIWTTLSDTVERLRVKNNRMALRQLVDRARMPFLADAVRRAAVAATEANVRNALVAGGHRDLAVRVVC